MPNEKTPDTIAKLEELLIEIDPNGSTLKLARLCVRIGDNLPAILEELKGLCESLLDVLTQRDATITALREGLDALIESISIREDMEDENGICERFHPSILHQIAKCEVLLKKSSPDKLADPEAGKGDADSKAVDQSQEIKRLTTELERRRGREANS